MTSWIGRLCLLCFFLVVGYAAGSDWLRWQSVGGLILLLGLAVLCSRDRNSISWRLIGVTALMQLVFAFLVLRVDLGQTFIKTVSGVTVSVLNCALVGSEFVFSQELVDPEGPAGFVFVTRVLPSIIFVSALFALLYHFRILVWIVEGLAWLTRRSVGTSGAESLNSVASVVLGQTEAPLMIKPYLGGMTRSELFTVLVTGMATVSGGVIPAYLAEGVEPSHILTAAVLNAPAALMIAKLVVPETEQPQTRDGAVIEVPVRYENAIQAIVTGTTEGLRLALNIAAMLVTFLALVAMINLALSELFSITLAELLGWPLRYVAWFLGVEWSDCPTIGGLLGTRTIANEIIAYRDLNLAAPYVSDRSVDIATFALCGFANLGSIGVLAGGIGVASERAEVAGLGPSVLLAATAANFWTACLAGLLL